VAGWPARVGHLAYDEDAVLEPQVAHGAREHRGAARGAIALAGEVLGELRQDLPLWVGRGVDLRERTGGDRDVEGRSVPAAPDDARADPVVDGPVQHDLVDEAAQERLLVLARQRLAGSERRQVRSQVGQRRPQWRAEHERRGAGRAGREVGLRPPHVARRLLPAPREFRRD
jgi:hypothetical protein